MIFKHTELLIVCKKYARLFAEIVSKFEKITLTPIKFNPEYFAFYVELYCNTDLEIDDYNIYEDIKKLYLQLCNNMSNLDVLCCDDVLMVSYDIKLDRGKHVVKYKTFNFLVEEFDDTDEVRQRFNLLIEPGKTMFRELFEELNNLR